MLVFLFQFFFFPLFPLQIKDVLGSFSAAEDAVYTRGVSLSLITFQMHLYCAYRERKRGKSYFLRIETPSGLIIIWYGGKKRGFEYFLLSEDDSFLRYARLPLSLSLFSSSGHFLFRFYFFSKTFFPLPLLLLPLRPPAPRKWASIKKNRKKTFRLIQFGHIIAKSGEKERSRYFLQHLAEEKHYRVYVWRVA